MARVDHHSGLDAFKAILRDRDSCVLRLHKVNIYPLIPPHTKKQKPTSAHYCSHQTVQTKDSLGSVVGGAVMHVCNLTNSRPVLLSGLERLLVSDYIGPGFEDCRLLLLFLFFFHLQDRGNI